MSEIILTKADIEIQECLNGKQSFSVVAGAGSGKTTSLINCLLYLKAKEGIKLKRDGKRIVCITYTNRAVDVILNRLGYDSLFYVSTLHKFLWDEIKRFTPNIREALSKEVIPKQIQKAKAKDNGGTSKVAIKARERVKLLTSDLDSLNEVNRFEYSDTKYSKYSEGVLDHDDVINIAAHLITENDILRRILGQKYPYIFVDEAQDTFGNIVVALNKLCGNRDLPLVGYFGDPMQQIYEKGDGNFAGPEGSKTITKEENYRCSKEVINLLNQFRTDVQQSPAGKNAYTEGSVMLSLIEAENPAGDRGRYTNEQVERALSMFDKALKDWGWENNENLKSLFLVRQMIARRQKFSHLHKLFTGIYASGRAQEAFEKGDHFLLKPFLNVICYLVRAHSAGDNRQIIDILRKLSPAFNPSGSNAKKSIKEMKALATKLTTELQEKWNNSTLKEILFFAQKNEICNLPERLNRHISRTPRKEEYDSNLHEIEKEDWLVDCFFAMNSSEINPFFDFINENTPFSTQHGVKGEEYKDVLVVFDDFEAGWNNYNFKKMLTPNTSGMPSDNQLTRSKKLAYVCFSRAEENLRILLFTPNPLEAKEELISAGLFSQEQIKILSQQ